VEGRIVGFEGFKELDKCTSQEFERRLALMGIIDYEGDIREIKLSSSTKPQQMKVIRKSTLRKAMHQADSSDEDW
jgi:hypothetical protein